MTNTEAPDVLQLQTQARQAGHQIAENAREVGLFLACFENGRDLLERYCAVAERVEVWMAAGPYRRGWTHSLIVSVEGVDDDHWGIAAEIADRIDLGDEVNARPYSSEAGSAIPGEPCIDEVRDGVVALSW